MTQEILSKIQEEAEAFGWQRDSDNFLKGARRGYELRGDESPIEKDSGNTSQDGWIEIKEGCKMPEPFYDVIACVKEHQSLWIIYWDGEKWKNGVGAKLTPLAWHPGIYNFSYPDNSYPSPPTSLTEDKK